VFSDGSVLDSIENIAVECGQRDDWNEYPYGRREDYFYHVVESLQTGHWWSREALV
jgi:hypothetical protein